MALAIYAVKCGITDRDRVKADMESLVPFLDSIDPEHPFGNDHEVENALECLDLRYKKFPIKDLERISGMAIPKNKRNYRKQPQHMEYLNGLRKMRRDVLGENEYENSGRPKGSGEKCELIRSYAREHPDANHSDIAKALGVSRTTVIKWLRDWKRVDVENEKREKRERETVKSSGTTVKLPDVSRETFPIDDRLNNGHNEA